jgi:hypothetical protein
MPNVGVANIVAAVLTLSVSQYETNMYIENPLIKLMVKLKLCSYISKNKIIFVSNGLCEYIEKKNNIVIRTDFSRDISSLLCERNRRSFEIRKC